MKTKSLLLLLFLCLNIATSFGQTTESRLLLSTPYPKPGEKIELTYNPASTKFENAKDVSAKVYFFNQKGTYTGTDLAFKPSGKLWKTELTLPDTTVYIALNIQADRLEDNNDTKGFQFALVNSVNKPVKGANLAEYIFYKGFFGKMLLGTEPDIERALGAFEKELALYPDSSKKYIYTYYPLLKTAGKKDKQAEIKKELLSIFNKKRIGEKWLLSVYYILFDEKSLKDSLSKIIRAHYPKGEFVIAEKALPIYSEKDPAKKVALYTQLKKEYGKIPEEYNNTILSDIARAYAEQKDHTNFKKYTGLVKNKLNLAFPFNDLAWKLAQSGKDIDFAASLSKQSLEYLDLLPKGNMYIDVLLPPSELKKEWYSMFADTYAFILYKQEKFTDALTYQQKAVDLSKGTSPEINERYTLLLEATGKTAEAKEKLETYIKSGKSTTKMKEQLKALYVKQKGTEQGYDAYMESLEASAKETMRKEILEQMTNIKAPSFSLKDMEGKSVSLEDLKGKVVVLDFWATWCRPCIASFPGMQKAVRKYKDNPDVKFLFINTQETGAKRLDLIKKLMEKSNYSFHVLLDEEKEGKHIVHDAFKVQGIPAKFVIDKNGIIRFKAEGFSGNENDLVDELSTMIDLVLNP